MDRAAIISAAEEAGQLLRARIAAVRSRDWRGLVRQLRAVAPAVGELVMVAELLREVEQDHAGDEIRAAALVERASLHAGRALERARALVPPPDVEMVQVTQARRKR